MLALISTPEIMNSVREILIDDLGTNVMAQYGAIEALKSKPKWIDYVKDTTFNNQKIIKNVYLLYTFLDIFSIIPILT